MMLRSKCIWGAMFALVLWPGSAMGDRERGPYPHSEPTWDGAYVFVMVPEERDGSPKSWTDPKGTTVAGVRPTYTESGLYRNDGSTTPLWTVDWYAHGFTPLPDGVHLVRRGPWARDPSSEAVAFFANGVLLKSYRVSDLVAKPSRMTHSVSHFMWRRSGGLRPETKEYEILTLHDEYYRFDVTTGEIIEERKPEKPDTQWVLVASALALGAVVLVLWFGCRQGKGEGE
jgi:hypothetical protein